MKFLFAIALLATTTFVQAETTVRYQAGDGGAAVIIHGMDSDALNLYEAMNVEASDEGSLVRKSILITARRVPILELMCVSSKATEAISCTLKFIPNAITVIDPEQGYAKFEVIDSYAAQRISNLFVKSNQSGPEQVVFQSENGKLRIWKSLSAYGQVGAFTAEFSE